LRPDNDGNAPIRAELASAECKAAIAHVPARIAIRQRRQEQGAGMGLHLQPIGDQRDGAEKNATHHF
jgi:hypothetical protein